MTVRVVLTVALVVALLGVTLPAVDAAGLERSETQVQVAADGLLGEARALAAGSDAAPGDVAAARRTVALDLPTRGFASAPLRSFRIEAPTVDNERNTSAATRPARVTWRVEGGGQHARRVADVALRLETAGPLRIDAGGTHRLVLSLVAVEDRRVVVVRRGGR